MNLSRFISLALAALVAATAGFAKPAAVRKAPDSDLAAKELRRAVVDGAANLARLDPPPALPTELPQPFSPPGFERELPSETKTQGPAQSGPPKPAGDRELLAAVAPLVVPTGTFFFGGDRYLQFSKKRLKVGDKLIVSYEGQDCTLELIAIDSTNFTLRLNHEEITRPIKPRK
ncbi:MAG TPA: hypothetical protein PLU52_04360 [Opitutaceae bacterium]|nr:hypothetical protein [Opitutaceae bacterium]HND60934.1 hypothetical protein [Opitutaceae bacterium]